MPRRHLIPEEWRGDNIKKSNRSESSLVVSINTSSNVYCSRSCTAHSRMRVSVCLRRNASIAKCRAGAMKPRGWIVWQTAITPRLYGLGDRALHYVFNHSRCRIPKERVSTATSRHIHGERSAQPVVLDHSYAVVCKLTDLDIASDFSNGHPRAISTASS